jgi:L-lactate utilization protein LutC
MEALARSPAVSEVELSSLVARPGEIEMTEARQQIFARITQALGREASGAPPAYAFDRLANQGIGVSGSSVIRETEPQPQRQLLELFTVRWLELGGEIIEPGDSRAAALGAFLASANCSKVAIEPEVAPMIATAHTSLADSTLVELPWTDEELRDLLFTCDAAITLADAAIAETGSLVMHSGARRARLASLAPPLHIALVRRETICADVIDALTCLSSQASSAFWITGPSKTADIAGILVRGIHGPGRVAVMFV